MDQRTKIPSSGDTTPEYIAVQKSFNYIDPAIAAISEEFVSNANSCGVIPRREYRRNEVMNVVLSEVSRDPLNYYALQYVFDILNTGDRFKTSISKTGETFLAMMKEYIPALSEHPTNIQPDCYKVFISFSRKKAYYGDSPDAYKVAKDLYAKLNDQGCKPWMDEEGLEYGEVLAEGIFTAIQQCDVIIPIMTSGYAKSLWCLRELYYAVLQAEPKKTIIPMLLEKEDDIIHQKAGNWLTRIGTVQKYFKPTETDAMIESLKDKLQSTPKRSSECRFKEHEEGVQVNMPDECMKFKSGIKTKYQERRINCEKQWPPCHANKLVGLELVERKKREGYSANAQRGRKDKDVKRTPLPYGNLFKVESGSEEPVRKVRKVLVEGDAGIGKTTLCISVSEDWANRKLFQQFELVLHLPLRMKAVASAGSLPELLKPLHSDPSIRDSVGRYLEKEEGENVLIIADGWDELSESERHEGSFLYQLLFQEFPLISVVLTSRPSASAPLHQLPCIDRFVEVCGFSKEHIVEYIKSEFAGDQKKADGLVEKLNYNPLIESVCSVPLNCAIVCHLWRDLEGALPTTMTELYKAITLKLILRNTSCKIEAYSSIFSLPELYLLPEELKQLLWFLCEFAFQALEKDQLVFSQREVEKFFPEGSDLDKQNRCFGLLQYAKIIDIGVSFHFLHLTFQEYLAALHLARQTPDKQLEVFQSHISKDPVSPFHFAMVERFFFGISRSLDFNIDICKIFECVTDDSHDLLNTLSLCHYAFEAQNDLINTKVTQFLVSHYDEIEFEYLETAYDCAAVLYVIANMQERCDIRIDFSNCGVRENQIKNLLDILASKEGKLQIIDLDLSGSRLTESGLQALENAVNGDLFAKLKFLVLESSLTSDADTNVAWLTTFVEALLTHCPHLFYLNLSDNNLGVPGASAVSKIWDYSTCDEQQHKSTCLYLNKTNLGDKGFTMLFKNLKVISELGLVDNDIHATCVSRLADAVCEGKVVIYHSLDLSDNPLRLEGTIPVGRMLSSSHYKTRQVDLSRCELTTARGDRPYTDSGNTISGETVRDVGQQLCQMPQNSSIIVLDLDGNSFTGESIHILAGFMHLCPCMRSFFTRDCGITSDDLIQLLSQLKSSSPNLCSKLETWFLENNQIDDNGVSALMDHLPSLFPYLWCKKYRDISLANNPVSSEMMERLEEELRRRYQESTSESSSESSSQSHSESSSQSHSEPFQSLSSESSLEDLFEEQEEPVSSSLPLLSTVSDQLTRQTLPPESASGDSIESVAGTSTLSPSTPPFHSSATLSLSDAVQCAEQQEDHQLQQETGNCSNTASDDSLGLQSPPLKRYKLGTIKVTDHQLMSATEHAHLRESNSSWAAAAADFHPHQFPSVPGAYPGAYPPMYNPAGIPGMHYSGHPMAGANYPYPMPYHWGHHHPSVAGAVAASVPQFGEHMLQQQQHHHQQQQQAQQQHRQVATSKDVQSHHDVLQHPHISGHTAKSPQSILAMHFCDEDECLSSPIPVQTDQLQPVVNRSPCQQLNEVIDFGNSGVSKHLGQIANTMYEWEGPVAEQLGLTPVDVAVIKVKHPGELKMQTIAALETWKQKLGSSATYSNLISVFQHAGYHDYADTVRNIHDKLPTSQQFVYHDEGRCDPQPLPQECGTADSTLSEDDNDLSRKRKSPTTQDGGNVKRYRRRMEDSAAESFSHQGESDSYSELDGSSTDHISQSRFYREAKKQARVPFLFHKILEIDNNGMEYTIKDHDITVRFSFGAVPVGEKLRFEIGVTMCGPFKFVDDVRPISPILWICPLDEVTELNKPFQLVLPHFLSGNKVQDHQVGFAKANHSNYEENYYTFYLCGTTPILASSGSKSYGILETNHCCFYCLEANNTPEIARDAGYALVRLEHCRKQEVHFCAIYLLKTCLQSLKEQFSTEEGYQVSRCYYFKFKDRGINFNYIKIISAEHNECTIAVDPVSAKIKESEIDFWNINFETLHIRHQEKMYPPRVKMTVDAPNVEPRIKFLFKFEGCSIDSQLDDMEILFPLRSTNVGDGAFQSNVTTVRSNTILTGCDDLDGVEHDYLDQLRWRQQELSCVKQLRLYAKISHKWEQIATRLAFELGNIDSIGRKYHDDRDRVIAVFRRWFDDAVNLPNGSRYPKSWQGLINLLHDAELGEVAIDLYRALSSPQSSVRGNL